jgi:DNA/RNA endonuclease YhcR with UshA esterase domain
VLLTQGVVRSAFAQNAVAPQEARNHVGEYVTVTGVVSGVGHSSRSNTTFINFGGRFPNHQFTAVIFRNAAESFDNVDGLDGKTVSVTGKVKMYRGKPEIVLNSPSQLRVVR